MSTKAKSSKSTLSFLESISGEALTLRGLLLAIRLADDESQVSFAAKLGISRQQLCDIERGRRNITPSLAAEYAIKLGYSREQFVRLSLQDIVNRGNLPFTVELTPSSDGEHERKKAA